MHRLIPILAVAFGTLQGQQPVPVKFEVASVKLSGANSVRGWEGGPGSKDPGRYSFGLATLTDLVMVAYDAAPFQISSKAPLDQQHFDLIAKLPERATKEEFRLMMRDFLSERFHFKCHIESKEFPAYELVVAKTGLKLKETENTAAPEAARPSQNDDFPLIPPGRPGLISRMSTSGGYVLVRLRSQQQPVSALARLIRMPDEPPVVDKTGLTGKYDFTLEYTRPLPGPTVASDPPPAPDLFDALQRQLGLQLVAKKLPFDVVVVESVDKLPTEN